MTFSELLKVMYEFLGTGQKTATFVSDFIGLLMGIPDTPDDAQTDDCLNPYLMHSDTSSEANYSTCKKLFDGTRKPSQQKASKILHYYRNNREELIDKICELEDEQKNNLQLKLETYGVCFSGANYAETIADVVDLILNSYCISGSGYDFTCLPTRSLSGNKIQRIPLQSAAIQDGKLVVGGIRLDLTKKLIVPDVIDLDLEEKYVNAILEAVVDASKDKDVITVDDIKSLTPTLQKFITFQRMNFYDAEYLRRYAREILSDGDSQFELLEEDVEAGIENVLLTHDGNGVDRMVAALEKSTLIQLTRSDLCNIRNAIGNQTRQGLCHELVNDGIIDSWVKEDE